jgi:RNA polymerase sigma-70 factor (ECF subfamily)
MESDEELLERIGRSDQAAFDALYGRHREAILRHAERMVADSAEDVVQETFLRVWRKGDQWERRGSALSWVYRIATNLSLNLLESRRRAGAASPGPAQDGEAVEDLLARIADASESGPEETLERADLIRLIREGVSQLTEGKRKVMESYLDEAGTLAEIARHLGLPLGTVKSRFHYASRDLREILDGREEWRDT